MATKEEIIKSLEGTIKTLELAHYERAIELRDLLYFYKVSSIYELEDLSLFKVGAELVNEMDLLKDLADELKHQVLKIREFNKI